MWMISLPCASSALARASTSKAVSVPSRFRRSANGFMACSFLFFEPPPPQGHGGRRRKSEETLRVTSLLARGVEFGLQATEAHITVTYETLNAIEQPARRKMRLFKNFRHGAARAPAVVPVGRKRVFFGHLAK